MEKATTNCTLNQITFPEELEKSDIIDNPTSNHTRPSPRASPRTRIPQLCRRALPAVRSPGPHPAVPVPADAPVPRSNNRSFNRASFTAVLLSRSLDMLASAGRGAQAAPPAPAAGTASPAAPGSIQRGDTVREAAREPPTRASPGARSAAAAPQPPPERAGTAGTGRSRPAVPRPRVCAHARTPGYRRAPRPGRNEFKRKKKKSKTQTTTTKRKKKN